MHPDAGWLRGKQFWNADQVIGDQIEQEVGGDARDATMFGLAHSAMLLAPSENALDHRPARLRHAIPRCRVVRSSMALLRFLPVLVTAWLCHMRRHADGAKIGDMIGRIVRLVLTGRDASACGFASRLQHGLRSPAFGDPTTFTKNRERLQNGDVFTKLATSHDQRYKRL